MRRRIRRPWFIYERTFHQIGRLSRRTGTSTRERLVNDILRDYFEDVRERHRYGGRRR